MSGRGGVELSLAGEWPKRKRVKAFSEAKNLPRTPLPAHEVRADPVFFNPLPKLFNPLKPEEPRGEELDLHSRRGGGPTQRLAANCVRVDWTLLRAAGDAVFLLPLQ